MYSTKISDLKLSAYASVSGTDGSHRIVEADAQTLLDESFHTHASLAPGYLAQHRRSVDTRVEAVMGEFTEDLAVFRYRQSDLIQIVPNAASPNNTAYINGGDSGGWGLEEAVSLRLSDSTKTSLSYAFQHLIGHSSDNNANVRFAPRHIIGWQLNFTPMSLWRSSITVRGVLDRDRPISDPRPAPKDYVRTNFTVARTELFRYLDASFTVENIFNQDAKEASPSPTSLPFDIPLPGRTWFLQLSLHR